MSSADQTQLLIIADDLTGTADAAVGCARAGLATTVVLGTDGADGAEAVAIDLDSRGCHPVEAAQRHRQALQNWQGRFRFLYKKIDSTLRGNVAAEIASLAATAGMAIVAPAYPATGRTTRRGRQYLNGTPVEETEVWINEDIQGCADLVEMLVEASLKTALLDLTTLHGSDESVITALTTHLENGVEALVCDAESDVDLVRLATLSSCINGIFWVGSAGLGEYLPTALGLAGARVPPAPQATTPHTLIVIGSMSAVSHHQADRLLESIGTLELIDIDAADLRPDTPHSIVMALEDRLNATLAAKHDLMVRLRQSDERNAAEGPALSLALARLLGPRLASVDRLIATGGATARALLTAADITELTLIDAPDTGMARLLASTNSGPLEVITKAGGFGDNNAFQRVWHSQRRNH